VRNLRKQGVPQQEKCSHLRQRLRTIVACKKVNLLGCVRVSLPVQIFNPTEGGSSGVTRSSFALYPVAEAALKCVHRRWSGAFASKEQIHGSDPGAVLDAGEKQGQVHPLDGPLRCPLGIYLPRGSPGKKL
jgi:hypothetical protein